MYKNSISKRNNSRIRKLVLFFTLSLLILIFLLIIILSLLFSQDESSSYPELFQYMKVSPNLNDTKYGFVTAPKHRFNNQPYLTYSDDPSSKIFISKFGEHKYQCTGTCECLANDRRFATTIKSGLYLLVSAISSTVALQIAQEAFDNACVHAFKKKDDPDVLEEEDLPKHPLCDPDQIIKPDNIDCEVEMVDDLKELEPRIRKWAEYECDGFCVNNHRLSTKAELETAEVWGDCTEETVLSYMVKVKAQQSSWIRMRAAKKKFKREVLIPYCKEMSYIKYCYIPGDGIPEPGKTVPEHVIDWAQMCTGESKGLVENAYCQLNSALPTRKRSDDRWRHLRPYDGMNEESVWERLRKRKAKEAEGSKLMKKKADLWDEKNDRF